MTLTEFLTARLDEDEAVARAALFDKVTLIPDPSGAMRQMETVDGLTRQVIEVRQVPAQIESARQVDEGNWTRIGSYVDGTVMRIYDEGGHSAEQAEHIARHDPARVLREVEAKRAIVALHDIQWHSCPHEHPLFQYEGGPRPCVTLRLLAAIYNEHADYDQAWRP